LGCHDKVLSIGPPHRMWRLKDEGFEGACLVHGRACEFWGGFDSFWNRNENFFIALSQYSGKSIFLMDNAPPDFINETMDHEDIEVLTGRYIRDARAITASYARKMEKNGVTYVESIQPDGWFYPSFQAIPSMSKMRDSNELIIHYEEAVNDQSEFLRKAGEFLGIEYSERSFRFWEWDHHITSGNQGPIAMIKLHQGLEVGEFESKKVYQEQLDRLKENPTKAFSDERWKTQLSKSDRLEFDRLMGEKNADLGYTRDFGEDHEHKPTKQSSTSVFGSKLKSLRSKFLKR